VAFDSLSDICPSSPTIGYLPFLSKSVTHNFDHDPFLYIASFSPVSSLNTLFTPSDMSSDISFGPPGQEWHYSTRTKTYDISGGSAKKMTISTTEGPKDTSVTIDPDSSALVVVDMQNFFLDPQCMEHPNGLKAVEPTITVIEKCREAGIQVSIYQPLILASQT
jgi:hypothetical protein